MPSTSRSRGPSAEPMPIGKHRRRRRAARQLATPAPVSPPSDSTTMPATRWPRIPLAHRGDRAGQIGPPRIGDQALDRRLGQRIADPEQLRPADLRERRAGDRPAAGVCGARDPRFAVGIGDAHAARHVDEHRDDDVTGVGRRQQDDRAARRTEHTAPSDSTRSGDQHAALHRRQRHERAPVGTGSAIPAMPPATRSAEPPWQRRGEMHRGSWFFLVASALK